MNSFFVYFFALPFLACIHANSPLSFSRKTLYPFFFTIILREGRTFIRKILDEKRLGVLY